MYTSLTLANPNRRMGLNVDQELFGVFAFYSTVVVVKMLIMAFLTAKWDMRITSPMIMIKLSYTESYNSSMMIDALMQAEIPHWQPSFPRRCSNCWKCIYNSKFSI